MASTSEVGNNKNVANFNTLALILEEMGTLYNPSNAEITLVNLNPIRINLAASVDNLNAKKPLYTNTVAEREIAMVAMTKKTSRVLNCFKSLQVSGTDKENANSIVKKIRGYRTSRKINPDSADATTISTSQLSFDSRIANIDVLISFINSHSEYHPNENDIQIVSLQSSNQELKNLTQTVHTVGNSLITARKERNDILYNGPENVIDLARDIKAYLKSLGDVGKPYYKASVRLRFKPIY
ncbi:MAG: hypothetical protein ABI426_10640 [Flavobacterium sp.]